MNNQAQNNNSNSPFKHPSSSSVHSPISRSPQPSYNNTYNTQPTSSNSNNNEYNPNFNTPPIEPNNKKLFAISSFVSGILSIIFCTKAWFFSPLALVLARIYKKSGETKQKYFIVAAKICSWLSLSAFLICATFGYVVTSAFISGDTEKIDKMHNIVDGIYASISEDSESHESYYEDDFVNPYFNISEIYY